MGSLFKCDCTSLITTILECYVFNTWWSLGIRLLYKSAIKKLLMQLTETKQRCLYGNYITLFYVYFLLLHVYFETRNSLVSKQWRGNLRDLIQEALETGECSNRRAATNEGIYGKPGNITSLYGFKRVVSESV